MAGKLFLNIGIHAHQPFAGPPDRIDRMVDDCYIPALNVFLEHPSVRGCAHFSGALLSQIENRRPRLIEMLKTLVGRNQIEILGGGMYEPILPSLMESDRLGQIRRFSEYLQRLLGRKPSGIWIAERVWEPALCRPLKDAGLRYVFLDDRQLMSAGVSEDDIHSTFVTEDAGNSVFVFPLNEPLRYMIPTKPARTAMDFLKEQSSSASAPILLTCVLDAETLDRPSSRGAPSGMDCFSQFAAALEKLSWVETITPSDWMAAHSPRDLVYVPTSASSEMTEWTMAAQFQEEYSRFSAEVDRHALASLRRMFLKTGNWRSFLTTYPESNWMQKRVMFTTGRLGPILEKLSSDRESRTIRDLLDRASCNDAYWSGGSHEGLFDPAIRRAMYEHLLEAENRFSKKMGLFPICYSEDIDLDGRVELLIYTEHWVVGLKPFAGGAMAEWSYRPARYNFQNVLQPRAGPKGGMMFQSASSRISKSSGQVYVVDPELSFGQWQSHGIPPLPAFAGEWESKVTEKPESFDVLLSRSHEGISFVRHIVILKRESKISFQASMDVGERGRPARLGVGFELFYLSPDSLSIRIGRTELEPGVVEYAAGQPASEIFISDSRSATKMRFRMDRDVNVFLAPLYASPSRGFQGVSVFLMTEPVLPGGSRAVKTDVDVQC